ncbi:MAG: FecR domain-containing protein [Bacteroidales bacterium]|nr:FecR domain-containing protein [Bacteroidales bacterium]
MEENDKYEGEIFKFLNGDLKESELSEFEKNHLNSEDDFNQLKDFNRILCNTHNIDTEKAWNNINSKLKPITKPKTIKLWQTIVAVAAVAIVSVILVVFTKDPIQIQRYTAQTACETFTLPDNSVVCLNKGASLEFQENFEGAERLVKFEGEAYFDIKHIETKPFVIKSGENTITVLGTEFNLNTTNKNQITISVTDGCVSLQNNEGNITISKNEEATAQNGKKPQKSVIKSNVLGWQAELLDFKDCTLDKVVEKLSYVYGTEIIIENEKLKSLKLTSKYTNAKIEDVMKGISTVYGIKANMSKVSGVWILE